MKTAAIIAGAAVVALLAAAGFYMIDVDQTQETRLPTVDVIVEEGQLPAYDAEVGSITMTQEEVDVTVPEVDVTMEEKIVTVPGVSITPPADDS
ncbi:hypothetical protein [Sulfitobacter sp. JB4-11]|uniref:hypothetical protein n=1 Tax=Sulfitobacter rhodophyticola TaxID=3238304 RepID=UPI003D815812